MIIKEDTPCPRCEAVTDLYRGSEERYLCLHCWAEERSVIPPARGNGKSTKAITDFRRNVTV